MATKLTHKVRNPKDLDQWLELWTAEITKTDDTINYTINPSEKWNIEVPITNVTVESGENIVTSNIGDNNEGLAYINQNKITKTIKANRGLSIDDNNTIGHNGTVKSESTSYSSSGSSVTIPIIKYDDYGHITEVSAQTHTINNLNIDSLDENFTPNTASENEPSNAKNFNDTIKDLIQENTWSLTFNSANEDGIVKAVIGENELGESISHANEIWASDGTSDPAWRKITNDMISGDEDEKISGDKITQNSATSSGVIPPSGSLGPKFWGVPSDENENSPKWSSMTLSSDPLPINYDKNTSTLKIGINDQWWDTPSNEDENSTDSETPSSWSKYIVKSVSYNLS